MPRFGGDVRIGLAAAAVAVAVAILASTGCGLGHDEDAAPKTNGEETKSAVDVLDDARAAFDGAGSVHVAGHHVEHGVTYTVDEQLVPGGGQVVERSRYGEARFVTKDAVFYLNVPSSVYSTGGQTIPRRLQGRWLQRSADDHSARISLGDFFRDLALVDGHLRPQVAETPGARPTVTITGTNGAKLTVAGSGRPVPLAYTNQAGTAYLFGQYGAPVTITAPTDAVSLSCGQTACGVS